MDEAPNGAKHKLLEKEGVEVKFWTWSMTPRHEFLGIFYMCFPVFFLG